MDQLQDSCRVYTDCICNITHNMTDFQTLLNSVHYYDWHQANRLNQSQDVCCSNARSCLRVSRFGQECTCSLWCGQGSDNKARQLMAGDVARDGVSLLGL